MKKLPRTVLGNTKLCIAINKPSFATDTFKLKGNAPLVTSRFSEKAINDMKTGQMMTEEQKKSAVLQPRDFHEQYENAIHKAIKNGKEEGWAGFRADGLRKALVTATYLVQKVINNHEAALEANGTAKSKITGLTEAVKKGVFVHADGFNAQGFPLIRILKEEPHYCEHNVKIGKFRDIADVRARAMFNPGWEANVRIQFDQDLISAIEITNLLMRVGIQIGIGEGRPELSGIGWGTFDLEDEIHLNKKEKRCRKTRKAKR